MYATLDVTVPLLPPNRPRYLMGVGEADDLVESVMRGIDIFDCVMPTRVARHGAALTPYGRVNVKKQAWARDERPIQDGCSCYACQHFSRAYIRHLFKAEELLGYTLLSLHNITFLIRHMEQIRAAILEGRLRAYAKEFLDSYLHRT
jgi:queuine tRNA-ribosyltransferase